AINRSPTAARGVDSRVHSGDSVGKVAVTFRLMPDVVGVDLEKIQARVRDAVRDRLKKLEVRPIAFGLKAVEAIVVVDDAAGELERIESLLSRIPGVGGVETTEVTLL
ncbi:MAG TPA: elongation factor 1-beta, partial [Thermoplasmata archaeon]